MDYSNNNNKNKDFSNANLTLSSSSITGTSVKNPEGKDLGNIKDLMIDTESGNIAYAVLSFGGFLGMGDKLFAIPFEAIQFDTKHENAIVDVTKEKLENAPGFDKDNWPKSSNRDFISDLHSHYGYTPYWEKQGQTI